MKFYQIITVTAILLTILNCESKKSNLLIKANNLHLEAMATQTAAEERLQKMKDQALRQKDSLSLIKIDSLEKLIHLWEEAVIEVPGFSHEHHGAEPHEHKPAPQMTDESMLEYQQNAKAAIDELDLEIRKIIIDD